MITYTPTASYFGNKLCGEAYSSITKGKKTKDIDAASLVDKTDEFSRQIFKRCPALMCSKLEDFQAIFKKAQKESPLLTFTKWLDDQTHSSWNEVIKVIKDVFSLKVNYYEAAVFFYYIMGVPDFTDNQIKMLKN